MQINENEKHRHFFLYCLVEKIIFVQEKQKNGIGISSLFVYFF